MATKTKSQAPAKTTAKVAPAKAVAPTKKSPVVSAKAPAPVAAKSKPTAVAAKSTVKTAGAAVKKPAAPVAKPAVAKPMAGQKAAPAGAVKKPGSPAVTQSTQAASIKSAAAKVQAFRAAAQAPAVAKPAAKAPAPAPVASRPQAAAALAKPVSAKISAPVAPAPAAPAVAAGPKKNVSSRHGFKTNEFVVYPSHGVGKIIGIEEQEIAGMSLELFVINFEKEKLTLRVPTGKLEAVGMRKLADEVIVRRAMEILKGRARIKRTMWSRRAQEYVAKINSGDLISIAEVVRDLYRSEAQPEQSYSERQLYEDALDRMAREIAAVDKLDDRGAVQRITDILSKSAKTRRAAEAGAIAGPEVEADPEAEAEANDVQAA